MKTQEKIVCIILARGGSKGIPGKNLTNFCGKPLLAWSIEHAKNVRSISSVWVSSDNNEILEVAKKYGADIILRPKKISKDTSEVEDGYLHAIKEIEKKYNSIDLIVSLQCTSPIRETKDIEKALKKFKKEKLDSMFSASSIGDFFIWQEKNGKYQSINHDYKNRVRKQDFHKQYVENGSFYIFKSNIIQKHHNRLGGKIGIFVMEFWKMFEIDYPEDLELCELVMKHYLLRKKSLKN